MLVLFSVYSTDVVLYNAAKPL